jgi:hypothetical protein
VAFQDARSETSLDTTMNSLRAAGLQGVEQLMALRQLMLTDLQSKEHLPQLQRSWPCPIQWAISMRNFAIHTERPARPFTRCG